MKRRTPYSAEFRQEAIRLVREEKLSQAKVARDLGISDSVLSRWLHEVQEPAGSALSESERAELHRLRRENRTLQMEREILKKATAFFAKESR